MPGVTRVLVVDDSAFMRRVISDLLESDPLIKVVGTARDGREAVVQAVKLMPDVITLDIEMPKLDGLSALRLIMAEDPRPVVMVSSRTQQGAAATIEALTLGAVDFVSKPSGSVSLDLHQARAELIRKVKAAAQITQSQLRAVSPAPAAGRKAAGAPAAKNQLSNLIVIAASTGGPGALYRLIGPLSADLQAGLLIVQHMPAGFTNSLARHLDQASGLNIAEGADGSSLADGCALVAPGGHHAMLSRGGTLTLSAAPPRHGVRPAADVSLESIPGSLAKRTLVIIMTGMGIDGARGAKLLKERGAEIWSQDRASSVVYGMPRAVSELGLSDREGPPEVMATWLAERYSATSPSSYWS